MPDGESRLRLLQDPEFKAMAARRDRIAAILTGITLLVYFGFIFLVAFGKEFLGRRLTPNITIGMPIGIGVIVVSWVLTGIYVRWANAKYDAMIRTLRAKAEGTHAP